VIVSSRPEGLVLVRQVDHQIQCGLMAACWGGEGFARPEPWGPLAGAAAWHDEGWRAWEARPEVGRDGRPVDFVDIPRPVHVDLYRRGIATCRARDPLAGLLVSLHGRGLYERRLGIDGPRPDPGDRPPAVREFLAEQEALQEDLRMRLHPDPDWEWAAYRILQAMDLLSLYLVWRAHPAGRDGELARVPRGPGDEDVTITVRCTGEWSASADPFPFVGDAASLEVAARVVPDRRYRDADDLSGEIAAAPVVTRPYVVHRPSRPGTRGPRAQRGPTPPRT
jgi:hypothetical protein